MTAVVEPLALLPRLAPDEQLALEGELRYALTYTPTGRSMRSGRQNACAPKPRGTPHGD